MYHKLLYIFVFLFSTSSFGLELGPFILTGFAKFEPSIASHVCKDDNNCQRNDDDDRQRIWVDEIAQGKEFGPETGTFSLFQPYLGTQKFHLGEGFKISALLSQRWRDGEIDIPGVWYERNITFSHDYYGTLQLGNFPTRGWGIADFPYGSHIGLADAWGASGSGYGINSRAIRYAFPLFDIFEGDFRFEYTYDFGDADYSVYTPQFHEVWLQFIRHKVIIDLMYQYAVNGQPGSWTHGPFRGITGEAQYESVLKASGMDDNIQQMLLLMSHFPIRPTTYIYMGMKYNHWSGSPAIITDIGTNEEGDELWNNMFNVNWNDTNDPNNPGYAASTLDYMLGARHRWHGKWTLHSGMVVFNKASTNNPLERGQSNSAILLSAGLGYQYNPYLSLYSFTGLVNYAKKGLAPLQMSGHSSYTGIDSRITQSGNSFGLGIEYVLR